MTQDKCVYAIRTHSADAGQFVREQVEEFKTDSFSADIIDEYAEDGSGAVMFEVEVNGDAYAIPVFEEQFSEMPDIEVVTADVSVGESKNSN